MRPNAARVYNFSHMFKLQLKRVQLKASSVVQLGRPARTTTTTTTTTTTETLNDVRLAKRNALPVDLVLPFGVSELSF